MGPCMHGVQPDRVQPLERLPDVFQPPEEGFKHFTAFLNGNPRDPSGAQEVYGPWRYAKSCGWAIRSSGAGANEVERLDDDTLPALVEDMLETMNACDGVGLAAPQIDVPLCIIVFGVDENLRYPDAAPVPRTVLMNPEIAPAGQAVRSEWEGCLSLPGMRGLVPRYERIHYRGLDADGQEVEGKAEGFHARIIQHECDHLDGILYPDRIEEREMFGFIEELQAAGLIPGALPRESPRRPR